MANLRLKHVHRYMKGGRLYHYFRRGDVNVRLPGEPGSREFMAAYQAALEKAPPPVGAGRATPRSMAALAASWYASHGFSRLTPASRRTYRRLLDAFLAEHGGKPVAQLEPRHLLQILEAQSSTPAQANALRNVLRLMLQHGFERGWRKDNPARDVKRLRYVKKPYPAWTEGDIAAFEARWPRGSRARLALALLLYTGQRRGDVIRMGPQHVRGGVIVWRQQKTGAELELPMHPELRAELAAAPTGHLAFLVTEQGRPFASGTGFYNWFKDCAAKAGVARTLSPHGLRKATARRLAEAGCTPHQIAAVTGHQSLKEVERYTRGADQRRLAASAVVRLGRPPENEA
jgi:integrase